MLNLLCTVCNFTKNVMFKMCDIHFVSEEKGNDIALIRRCLTDVANRTYCASSIKIENNSSK